MPPRTAIVAFLQRGFVSPNCWAADECEQIGSQIRVPGERSESRGTRVARARRVRSRGARSEPLAVTGFTMSNSMRFFVPAARCCARVSLFLSRPPQRGVGGAPTGALSLLSRLRDATGRASEARRVPRRGTLASRRSTVAIFGRGPRFHLRHCLRIRAASSSQPGRHAWRAVSRTSRARGYEPRPQDATPRSAFGTVSGRRPS